MVPTALDAGMVEVRTDDELRIVARIVNWALDRGLELHGLSVTRVTLEDVYLELTAAGRGRDVAGAPVSGPVASDATGRTGIGDVRLVAHQVRYESLAFCGEPGRGRLHGRLLGRVPRAARFERGSSRISYLGDIKLIQYYVPAFVAYGVMAACFTMLAVNLVVRRETGLLKRLRLSPLPTWVLLSAIFISTMIVALVQVVLLLVIGRLGYHVPFPRSPAALVVVLVVGIASFTAMGVAVSTVIPNQEAAGPLTSTIFFVLLFLSGLSFPLKASSGLAKFSFDLPRAALHRGRGGPLRPAARRVPVGVARPAGHRRVGSGGRGGVHPSVPFGPAPQLA